MNFFWKKKFLNGPNPQYFFFNFNDKNNLANFKKRKEKYSRIYTLTIPKFPISCPKRKNKTLAHKLKFNFQGFFLFANFVM
jgi:hypothetical protein